jgi:hypothetical protein
MKRIILILLFLLCNPWNPPADAWMNVTTVGGGVAASGCTGTCKVGDTTTYSTAVSLGVEYMYCMRYAGAGTGNLSYAHISHDGTSSENAKVCVYSSSDTTPQNGDAKIGCSGAIAANSDAWYQSAGKLGGAVTDGTNYWVCIISDTTNWSQHRNNTTGSKTWYWYNGTGIYASPPATLTPPSSWSNTADRDISCYVDIE